MYFISPPPRIPGGILKFGRTTIPFLGRGGILGDGVRVGVEVSPKMPARTRIAPGRCPGGHLPRHSDLQGHSTSSAAAEALEIGYEYNYGIQHTVFFSV
jgi:hypothetical protein